ncbi:GGDEF and EAL domain-containing protein [Bacillus sp. OK048]|uniref:sensor domain-containing protein n=1 Tax=Bacillus sp. OK048 TaxID=1882761 RepID=UPI00088516FC|nr:GGDEF and EAL domain-containing protein [Bacillus sp. OK048]SDM60884.1 diguanylate cyclase/phosphodiesterase with PAS/PAC sensor(s) [Bacillus sp. OK048]
MIKKGNVNRFIFILIFCLLIAFEAADSVFPEVIHSIKIVSYVTIAIYIATLFIIFYLLKQYDKKADEYQKSQQKMKNIFDTLDVAIWSHDLKTDRLLITPGIEKLYGYKMENFYEDKNLWKEVIFPEDLHVLEERAQKLAMGQAVTSQYRIIRPDGEVRWIQDRGIPTVDQKGDFIDFNSVLFDITDRKESEGLYQSLVEMSPDIIAVVYNGKIEYINEAGCKLIGADSLEEVIGQSAKTFVTSQITDLIKSKVFSTDKLENERFMFEFQVRRIDGESIDVEMAARTILYEGRFAVQVVGRDITQRKKSEQTIKFMAYYDTLTGLSNRNQFRNHLNEVLRNQVNKTHAVFFLDLDRFKIINDTKGHTVGDIILQKVAGRLENAVQNEGLVSRQGGDEFIILLEDIDKENASQVAKRILNEFSNPFEVNGDEFYVTPSIGISIYPKDGRDEEALIKNADTAMYQAKDRGKNNYQFYSNNLDGISTWKMKLENWLRRAIEQNQMALHYQPQFDLGTGEIVGVEALIRWNHPEYGYIAPSEFIPLAEETGLIVPLGKWILREAFERRKAWKDAGYEDFPIAVNVSVRQFQDENIIPFISEMIEEVGLEANYLELEITESLMQNLENSTIILNRLKDLGVQLSVDDFGTGYSSLSYLKHLPIDKIKIDKSFVDDIISHSNQGMMVKTIIDMGMNLKFSVIAEGIETEEQVKFLTRNACQIGQGYYYSKPLSAEKMEEFLLKGNFPTQLG